MALPTVTYAEWLQAESLFTEQVDAAIAAAWQDDALTSETLTAIVSQAAAQDEAVRQMNFLGQPLAVDSHAIVGRIALLIGRTVTIYTDRLGYAGGVNCLVLGAVDDIGRGVSQVTVLRVV